MDSIRISTGEKRIAINDDPNRIISFNPQDVVFAEKFYRLISEFELKQAEYMRRSDEIEAEKMVDEHGIPANIEARLGLVRETCEYLREQVDILFGAGTSQKVFGDAMVLEAFIQFFDGITPFIQQARAEKIAQYSTKRVRK